MIRNETLQLEGFDPRYFAQYDQLSRGEKLFLRTCCYFPPRPPRPRTADAVIHTDRHRATYESAFGPEIWSQIAGKDVLDLGCGEGGYVLALAEGGARTVTGLDTLPAFDHAIAECQRRGLANVAFIGESTEAVLDAQFDVVISHDSFEHFDDPGHVLAEMVRLTKPGGLILIKFGPPWRNPWGRHMGGTIRRDRPWIHLVVPERTIMRCHSVYHNSPILSESYSDLDGGLNKMTVGRFRKLLGEQPGLDIETLQAVPLYRIGALTALPVVDEFFAAGVRAVCRKQ